MNKTIYFLRLIFRNAFRHRLRTGLTAFGIVLAIVAFGMLRTVVSAFYAGVDAASATRLITRNAISLVVDLPVSYLSKIRKVSGVKAASYASWFGGVYVDKKNFFAQFAIEPSSYLELYPEYFLSEEEKFGFLRDRRGAIAGAKLAQRFGWKIGDSIPLRGTKYPGNWTFVLRGIYRGAEKTEQSQFFFHWDYLEETRKKTASSEAGRVGVYVVVVKSADRAAEVARDVDRLFKNSSSETLTETEKAFSLGFVAMTEIIVLVIQIVSYLVIFMIMAVMANTMAMTARERKREYAILKALGFGPRHLVLLIFGESLLIAAIAGVVGDLLMFPAAEAFVTRFPTLFPAFNVAGTTVLQGAGTALLVGAVAAALPAWRAVRIPINEGLASID